MNTFALLLAATCAPGADPVTVVQYSTPPSSAAYSGMNETVQQESRPRFFGRIRAFFNRRSQNAETMPADAVPSYSRSTNGSFNGPVMSQQPLASPSFAPVPAGPSIITPSGSTMPSTAMPAQRMPSGNPF